MRLWRTSGVLVSLLWAALCFAQSPKPGDGGNSSSSRSKKAPAPPTTKAGLDAGSVADGVYRNKSLGLACKIPAGWVLRTEEMNARPAEPDPEQGSAQQSTPQNTANSGLVLLAAFSRPSEAKGEDVNSSIVIAAEPVSAYPGLTEAVQYVGPLTEVAKAQGFENDEDPYEVAIGPKTLVQVDFHKNVGSRVMRQSTLIFLAKGYALSITLIGGTEDEVTDLVDGIAFTTK